VAGLMGYFFFAFLALAFAGRAGGGFVQPTQTGWLVK